MTTAISGTPEIALFSADMASDSRGARDAKYMKVIKSVADLPDWFKEKKYEKTLSVTDWYREIRKRQYGVDAVEFMMTNPHVSSHHARDVLYILHAALPKEWPFFWINQQNYPIEDMSKMEAMYLAACFDDPKSQEAHRDYSDLMQVFKSEVNHPKRTVFSRKYEDMLSDFFNKYAESEEMSELVYPTAADGNIGGLYLSYGRPLKGYPVIIDTQYDDATIIGFVQMWLADRRKENGEKAAKRPFLQNDFDDWAYFKIREVVDLDTWARANDVKILDKVMAAAIWPNAGDEISPIDMLRTTSRKKVKEIFRFEICVRLYGQLMLDLGENFLEE